VSCTAGDGAGNSGAAAGSNNTATVQIDTIAPEVVLDPGATVARRRATRVVSRDPDGGLQRHQRPLWGCQSVQRVSQLHQSTTTNGSAVPIASPGLRCGRQL
jgi:hypothetical protein